MNDLLIFLFFFLIAFAIACGIFAFRIKNKKEKALEDHKTALLAKEEWKRKLAEAEEQHRIQKEKYYETFEKYNLSRDAVHKVFITEADGKYKFEKQIIIFPEDRFLYVFSKKILFSDIISSAFEDNANTIKGQTTLVTQTDTGDMIGRSIVGGLLLGETGAIIGGATAPKNTVLNNAEDIVYHHFLVKITIKDIMNPLITIDFGEHKKQAEELYNTLLVIKSYNN